MEQSADARSTDRLPYFRGAQVKLQPGATLSSPPMTRGSSTSNGLAPGNYTLTISYIGFSTLTQQVKVTAGQVSHVEASMKVLARSEEVTVVGERPHGEAEAINRERTSDNILQVLPAM